MAAFLAQGTFLHKLARVFAIALALAALSYLVYCAGADRSSSDKDKQPAEKLDPYMPSTKSAPVEIRPEDLQPGEQQKKQEQKKKKKTKDSQENQPDIYAPSTKVGVLTRPLKLP